MLQRPNMGNAPGVTLQVRNGEIGRRLYRGRADTNLRTLGQTVQRKVREALDQMVACRQPGERLH